MSLYICPKPTEWTPPRMNANVNYELWMIIMCQSRFINYNKCTPLGEDTDNEGGYAWVGAGGVQEISVPSAQYSCEHKLAIKTSSIKKPQHSTGNRMCNGETQSFFSKVNETGGLFSPLLFNIVLNIQAWANRQEGKNDIQTGKEEVKLSVCRWHDDLSYM